MKNFELQGTIEIILPTMDGIPSSATHGG